MDHVCTELNLLFERLLTQVDSIFLILLVLGTETYSELAAK